MLDPVSQSLPVVGSLKEADALFERGEMSAEELYYKVPPVYGYSSRPGTQLDLEENRDPQAASEKRTIRQGDPQAHFERLKAGPPDKGGVVEGVVDLHGGQAHFYLETHNCVVTPANKHGLGVDAFEVLSSTQSPANVAHGVSTALGLPRNSVHIHTARVGGGFGGKQTRGGVFAACAAVPAYHLGVPIKLVPSREEDMEFCPGRSPFLARYRVGWEKDDAGDARLVALECDLGVDAGSSQDYSVDVLETAMFVLDSGYNLPGDLHITGRAARTNRGSYTATRGFGKPQAAAITECFMDHVATAAGEDPNLFRARHLYKKNDRNLTGQVIGDDILRVAWDGVFDGQVQKGDLPSPVISDTSPLPRGGYAELRQHCDEFNSHPQHRWIKRGVAVIPSKGNMGFIDCPDVNRASCVVNVHADGSVSISHSGVEMGQGLATRMRTVASKSLQIPAELIKIEETTTEMTPNSPPTTMVSTDMAGQAIQKACADIMSGLGPLAERLDIRTSPEDTPEERAAKFRQIVKLAYDESVPLSAIGSVNYPRLAYDWEKQSGDVSYFFVWGAALSVVELDVLTGTIRILREDIVQDCGRQSLNPALDVGQVRSYRASLEAGCLRAGGAWVVIRVRGGLGADPS